MAITVLASGGVLSCLTFSETVMGIAIVESALGYEQWRGIMRGVTTVNRLSVAYLYAVIALIANQIGWDSDSQ